MKIADVTIHRMATPVHKTAGTNWMFVKITTEDGQYGIGEASTQYKDAGVAAEIMDFRKYLIGKDPFQIEYHWTSMYRRVTWSGGAVTMSAISGIDLALWDLKAKALDVPVYELLGGKSRDRVRTYANGWFEGLETPEEHAKTASEYAAAGWTAMKFYPFKGPQVITPDRIQHGVDLVRAVREAVGPSVEIAVDIRARLDMRSARQVAQRLEEFNIAWLEEPVLWDNVDALAQFAKEARVPISSGEQLYNRWDFHPLIESNAIDIIQPDICHAGGLSELRKIAAHAETHYVSVAPHNSNGPISTVASLHLDMVIPNVLVQEIFVSFMPAYDAVLTNPIVVEDGYTTVPEGPGWGTDVDLDALENFPPGDYAQIESEPYREF
jgi:galactonate dehydratase